MAYMTTYDPIDENVSPIKRSPAVSQVLKDLESDGVAVLPNVMTNEECDYQINLLKAWIRKFKEDEFPKNVTSIIHQYGMGHSQTSWECRMKTKPIFAQIYGTEKLLTSFDGVAISRPPEEGVTKFAEGPESWNDLHHDQGPQRKGLHAIQGALYLEEATEEDWCFKVITGSHKHHTDFFDEFEPHPSSEHRKIKLKKNSTEKQWLLNRGGKVKRIACPKGGMILWDSRTIHAGAPPLEGRLNVDRWRFCVFVCMTPAKWATEKDYAAKLEGYRTIRTSGHWPANGFQLVKDNEKHHGLDLTSLPPNALTEEAKYLAGTLRYDVEDTDLPDWYPQ